MIVRRDFGQTVPFKTVNDFGVKRTSCVFGIFNRIPNFGIKSLESKQSESKPLVPRKFTQILQVFSMRTSQWKIQSRSHEGPIKRRSERVGKMDTICGKFIFYFCQIFHWRIFMLFSRILHQLTEIPSKQLPAAVQTKQFLVRTSFERILN